MIQVLIILKLKYKRGDDLKSIFYFSGFDQKPIQKVILPSRIEKIITAFKKKNRF